MREKERRIAVISDTHGLLRDEVLEVLNTCQAIFHGGDICSPEILERLRAYAPVFAVRGNNDKEWAGELPKEQYFELWGLQFYMVHKKKDLPRQLKPVDVVIYGHSHKYEEYRENGIFYLNPGSCGPGRFHQPATMAVLTLTGEKRLFAEKIQISTAKNQVKMPEGKEKDLKKLAEGILRDLGRGDSVAAMAKRYGADREFTEQICRIVVTHPGVSAQGILDKLEVNALLERENKAQKSLEVDDKNIM